MDDKVNKEVLPVVPGLFTEILSDSKEKTRKIGEIQLEGEEKPRDVVVSEV